MSRLVRDATAGLNIATKKSPFFCTVNAQRHVHNVGGAGSGAALSPPPRRGP
jgi:hypothetical protein